MAPPAASPLEILPHIALNLICEYLNDESVGRSALWAFSLTSKRCCEVATPQRFCQIQLSVADVDEFKTDLARWAKILSLHGSHRHVRRLKVSGARKKASQRQAEEEGDGSDEEDADRRWKVRDEFPMHDFCRPPGHGLAWFKLADDPEAWLSLSHFISRLPGLKDLVWASGHRVPGPVLASIHATNCRLHMHCFYLPSLIQSRDSPQPIDPEDWALASSPSLASIVTMCTTFTDEGKLDYMREAVMRMVAGTAPNLTHLWLVSSNPGDSMALREAIRLGKPSWRGFFPRSPESNVRPVQGRLARMAFWGYPPYGFEDWGRATDLTKLRRLDMGWYPKTGGDLAEMAVRGDLKSLDSLSLWDIEDEDATESGQQALNRLLENLPPLQRLNLAGYFRNDAVDCILRRHGSSLRGLGLLSCSAGVDDDGNPHKPHAVFSTSVVQRLVDRCPGLEELVLSVPRTRGDDEETGIYRALSRLPRLRTLQLRLMFTVEPDNREDWPESTYFPSRGIPHDFIRDAFSNCAVDATLARAIFDMVSAKNGLGYLRLEPARNIKDARVPGLGFADFEDALRWFARKWVCRRETRSGVGLVTVRELDKKATARGGEQWQYIVNDPRDVEEDMFPELFKANWPQKTPLPEEWWRNWTSLPLSEAPT